MDKLAEAIAQAVQAGTAIAPTALIGYYVVRIVEALCIPLGFIGVAIVVTRCIRWCVDRCAITDEKRIEARKEAR